MGYLLSRSRALYSRSSSSLYFKNPFYSDRSSSYLYFKRPFSAGNDVEKHVGPEVSGVSSILAEVKSLREEVARFAELLKEGREGRSEKEGSEKKGPQEEASQEEEKEKGTRSKEDMPKVFALVKLTEEKKQKQKRMFTYLSRLANVTADLNMTRCEWSRETWDLFMKPLTKVFGTKAVSQLRKGFFIWGKHFEKKVVQSPLLKKVALLLDEDVAQSLLKFVGESIVIFTVSLFDVPLIIVIVSITLFSLSTAVGTMITIVKRNQWRKEGVGKVLHEG